MFPQVSVDQDPQVALADGDEDRRLRNGVGGKIMKLHPVVVAERADEIAGRNAEVPLVQSRQANDVAARGVRRRPRLRRNPHWARRISVWREQPGGDQRFQILLIDGGPAHGTESMSCTFAIATVEERWRKNGLKKGKVRPLSLCFSFSFVCLLERRTARGGRRQRQSKLNHPVRASLFSCSSEADSPRRFQIYRIQCGRYR